MQRAAKLFKKAVTQQTGIVGLFSHLKDDDVEALFADDTHAMDNSSVMYIASYLGLVLVPGAPVPR